MSLPAYKVNVFYWDSSDFEILQPAYKVSVFYWDKLGDSENSRLILEVVYISRHKHCQGSNTCIFRRTLVSATRDL